MKWVLYILVSGSPVQTSFTFDSLAACLRYEDTVAAEYSRAYTDVVTQAKQRLSAQNAEAVEGLARTRLHRGTCIPK